MHIIKSLSIVFCATLFCTLVCAQETGDYYKFDDNGVLVEFLQTTPDGVKISYVYRDDNKMGLITYPDGTQIDYTKSLAKSFDGPRIYPDKRKHNINGALPIKDWYKELRKETSAPTVAEMLDGVFGIREVVIIFPDNSQAWVDYDSYGVSVKEYVDISETGNRLSMERCYGTIKFVNLCNPKLRDPETGDYSKTAKLAYGEDSSGYGCEGSVILEDGSTFTGTFWVSLSDEKFCYDPKSPYIKELFGNNLTHGDESYPHCPWYGLDNIIGISLGDGSVVNKENKIVAIYKNYKQLDEFDMASELAAAQGKIDRERAAAKKAASEKAAITSKYGQKYANAFFAGKVIVGMPWSLVEIGIDAHSFKTFYTALLSIERQTAGGSRKCYELIGDDLSIVGNMWVYNGAVQSVTYF